MEDYYVPRLYISGFIHHFERKAERYGLKQRMYQKGEMLTRHGVINNTSHFIQSGLVHLALNHSSGNARSIMFFGPGTIFPIGVVPHENLIDYEMVMTALTDVQGYSFSYPQLRQMCVEDGEFAAQILEENCKIIGYLFYQEMNHAYLPTRIRVCDVLYLFLTSIGSEDQTLSLRQEDLASMVGISLPQLERILKELRSLGIIQTSRGQIKIMDIGRLRSQCSTELRENG